MTTTSTVMPAAQSWQMGADGDRIVVSANDALDAPADYWVIGGWVRFTDLSGSGEQWLYSWGAAAKLWFRVYEASSASAHKARIYYNDGSTAVGFNSSTTPGTNSNWQHWTVERNGNDIKLYVDGVEVGSGDCTGITALNADDTVAFGASAAGSNPLGGKLSHWFQYNGTITADQRAKLSGTGDYNGSPQTPDEVFGDELSWHFAGVRLDKETAANTQPVAHYLLNETSGSTITDSAPAGAYDGTASNAVGSGDLSSVTGPNSGSVLTTGLDFGGAENVGMGVKTITGRGARSVCFWFKTDGQIGDDWEAIVSEQDSAGANRGFIAHLGKTSVAGKLMMKIGGDGNPTAAPSYTDDRYDDSAWHWACFTWDGTTDAGMVKVFVDDVTTPKETATANDTDQGGDSYYNFQVSGRNGANNEFDGAIADVRIYHHALSEAERTAIYASGAGLADTHVPVDLTVTNNGVTLANDAPSGICTEGDYADLAAWESARDGESGDEIADCYGGGDLGICLLTGGWASRTITIQAASGESPYISTVSGGHAIQVYQTCTVVVDGLTNTASGFILRARCATGSTVTVQNCSGTNNAGIFYAKFSSGALSGNHTYSVRNCKSAGVRHCCYCDIAGTTGSPTVACTVRHNTIDHGGNDSYDGILFNRGVGISFSVVVDNNLAIRCGSSTKKCYKVTDTGGGDGIAITARNNLDDDDTASSELGDSSSTYYTGDVADLFNDLAGGDYSLALTSDARNAGINLAGTVTTDITGRHRPQGSAYDVGAYETAEAARSTYGIRSTLSI